MKLTIMATIQQQPSMKARTLTLREKDRGCVTALDWLGCEAFDPPLLMLSLTVSTIEFELLLGISWFVGGGGKPLVVVVLSNAKFLENKGQNHVGSA